MDLRSDSLPTALRGMVYRSICANNIGSDKTHFFSVKLLIFSPPLETHVLGQGSHRNSKTKFHDFSMINNVVSMII